MSDQPVPRRLRQAGAIGHRRLASRRRHPGAGLRYRFDRRTRRTCCRPTGRRACPTTAPLTHPPSFFWFATATPSTSRIGTTWCEPGVSVITPNPKTSGGARWAYLAAWGYALKKNNGDDKKAQDFVTRLYKNVPVLDSGARGSTTTFAQRGIGDVLLDWENEAFLAAERTRQGQGGSCHAFGQHSGRAAGCGSRPGRRQTRHDAGGQGVSRFPIHRRRPGDRRAATSTGRARRRLPPSMPDRFPKVQLFTIDEVFGGWQKAQKRHFDDGGVFDQIYLRGHSAACRTTMKTSVQKARAFCRASGPRSATPFFT